MEKDGSLKHSFYASNGNLSKVVRPNQYAPQADDGAAQELEYDARGNIVGVEDGNRNSTKENWKWENQVTF